MITRTFKKDDKVHVCNEFDSWHEYVSFVKSAPSHGRRASEDTSTSTKNFTGSKSFNHAIDMATNGWAEGNDLITSMTKEIEKVMSHQASVDVYESAPVGEYYDIGDVIVGVPDCARYAVEQVSNTKSGKIVEVGVNISASCGISTQIIVRRGAAVVALVDCLESLGYRCNVSLMIGSSMSGKQQNDRVSIKSSDNHVDRGVLAFALIHPSSLRRLGFRMTEWNDREQGWMMSSSSYGCPAEHVDESQFDICMTSSSTRDDCWRSTEGAVKWIKDWVKKYTDKQGE